MQHAGFAARRALTSALKNVNVIIPLNRYSFFEELKDKMLIPMQLQLSINIQNDDELIYKLAAVDDGRVVINRFLLWVPKLIPKDILYKKFINDFLVKSSWNYKREMNSSSSAPTHNSGFFQISSSIDNVQSVFVYLQRVNKQPRYESIHIGHLQITGGC